MEEFRVRFFGRKQPEIFKVRYIQKVLDTPDFQRYIPISLKKQWEKERKRDGNRESEKPSISSQHNIAKGTNPSKIQEARSIVILLEASLEMLQDDRIETDALKVVREKLSEVTQLLR